MDFSRRSFLLGAAAAVVASAMPFAALGRRELERRHAALLCGRIGEYEDMLLYEFPRLTAARVIEVHEHQWVGARVWRSDQELRELLGHNDSARGVTLKIDRFGALPG